jgi:hypothetical protein
MVWATLDATTPGRDRHLFSAASIRVSHEAPGTATLTLTGVDAGAKGRIELTVISTDDDSAQVRVFAVPQTGRPQSLAPHVELTIDDLGDDDPPWKGTLDEFESLVSFDSGLLPSLLAPGERREYLIRYEIAKDARRSDRASVVMVWQAEAH